MTATGYVSTTGDTRKVDVSGDTMTGDLVLADSTPDTDLSAASKEYVDTAVAAGGGGAGTPSGTVTSETSFGQASSAGVAGTFSRGDHTHGTPELTGVVLTSGDQVVNGEKTFNTNIPVFPATDPAFDNQGTRKAYVDKVRVRTATVRVTDDNLSGLPAAASWTVVQTSANTKLQCQIAAAVGDRIRVYGAFMHIGAHFLDWALLDNTGVIAVYAASGTGLSLSEGNPTLYPSASFLRAGSPDMFTVASGHINAGLVTVALVHQGLGTGSGNIVYAHATYPFRLRLENIGAEPS